MLSTNIFKYFYYMIQGPECTKATQVFPIQTSPKYFNLPVISDTHYYMAMEFPIYYEYWENLHIEHKNLSTKSRLIQRRKKL